MQLQCTIEFFEIKTFGKTGRFSGKSGMSNHLSGANAQFIIVSATLLCGGQQNGDDEPSELEDIVQSVKRYDVHVEALRKNEQEKLRAEFNEQQYRLQMEYYQQLKERQEETRALWHDIKKYILAMQAVAERGNSEELHKIVRDATDAFERSKNISTIGNPVVDSLLNQYLHTAEENGIKVTLDVTIPEVLSISPLSLSILIGNTFDNAIEACCGLPPEQRKIHLQLRKQYRSLFYRLDNPYSDISRSLRVGSHHGYGLKNVKRVVKQSDGDFYAEKKNGTFTVKVRLNCEN